MKRAVWVLAFLGILAAAGNTALANDYGGWHRGGGHYGHYRPYHRGYYGRPGVAVYPPNLVTPRPVYESWAYPWGYAPYQRGYYDPYQHGVVRFYGNGFGFVVRF
jgi:hypothetical protein